VAVGVTPDATDNDLQRSFAQFLACTKFVVVLEAFAEVRQSFARHKAYSTRHNTGCGSITASVV
jgi:hypothetical protein